MKPGKKEVAVDTEDPSHLALIGLVILAVLIAGFLFYRRLKRKRAEQREKLLKEQNESYDTTAPANKDYRNVYKKAVLKASSSEPKPAKDGRSEASGVPAGAEVKREAYTDDDIYNIVVISWYEHLIRHTQTEYLRTIVKNSSGMVARDLVPEMRMLLQSIPEVPLNRWSALTVPEKEAISAAAVTLRPKITQSVGKRFKMAVEA